MIETKFKNTDIGPIPVDWEVKTLGKIGKFDRGRGIVKKDSQSGDINAIRYAEIYTHHRNYISEYISHISRDVAKMSVELMCGDICFAGYGETLEDIGKAVAKIDSSETFAGQNTIVLRPSQKISALFYGYYLNTPAIATQKSNKANGSSIMLITPSALSDVFIAVPPLAEQEVIGEALREVDELIEGLKKLVAKKRAIKQGAMSQLLSGKSRLPGFSEPWKEMILDSLADINPSCDLPDCFEYVDLDSVSKGVLLYHRTENRQTAPSRAQRLAKFGDIFFQTVRPYQKNNFYFDKDITTPFVFSTGYAQLRPYINGVFLYHAMQSSEFVNIVLLNCIGTSYPSINATTLGELTITIPTSLAEQEAIAKVLTDMDAEIEALSRKVAKYEQVKQGMMQQLLTGKIRLV